MAANATNDTWRPLDEAAANARRLTLAEHFATDPERAATFTFRTGSLLVDLSKCWLDRPALDALLAFARSRGVGPARDALLRGDPVNVTERRAALHTLLRTPAGALGPDHPFAHLAPLAGEVTAERERFLSFAERVRDGSIAAADGARFTDVVNLGIGGSDLGPRMATRALAPYCDGPRCHFVANVDGAATADTFASLDPARTLVVISSKSFSTIETMTNAATARAWLSGALGEAAAAHHLLAVTTATTRAAGFSIPGERTFGFWDWTGGRYSVWSSIGLALAIAIGRREFEAFLAGGHAMDEHFRTAPDETNIPMLLGLLDVWNRSVHRLPSLLVAPYDERLELLPAYLQQLVMESNGKSVGCDGRPVGRPTAAVVWGSAGTNGQHAYFQLLHQGTEVVPAEFLIAAEGHEPHLAHHHAILVANCLAQSEALLTGRGEGESHRALVAAGHTQEEAARLAPHATFPGDRPSATIAYRRLTPHVLGELLALYEHRVFVAATLWGINPFDQYGVELGKQIALGITGDAGMDRNASTRSLLAFLSLSREGHSNAP
ncbi:MAG: glucose-6-phosphate isomerase [Rhizobiales bacterium]|nr:glucose-6-phosphate isomerase [Hyphomicrobiales bacterium]